MHPINTRRIVLGQYHTIMDELKGDPNNIFSFFRMSLSTFNELLEIHGQHIKRQNTRLRKPIGAEERLSITFAISLDIFLADFIGII